MKEEYPIKNLEDISVPEIEIPSHRRKLRAVLLGSFYKERRNWGVFSLLWKTVPVASLAIILAVIGINNFSVQNYNFARAAEIASKDPQVKSLIERGGIIKDTKIVGSKAYLLVQTPRETKKQSEERIGMLSAPSKNAALPREPEAILAEVDFKDSKVLKIEDANSEVVPLSDDEKERARSIANKSSETKEVIPKEAQIQDIKPVYTQLKLIRKGNLVTVAPESGKENKALIIYKKNGNKWESTINMEEERVENIDFFEETEK